MSPGHRHHGPAGDGLAEGFGPPHHGDPLGARSLELRVLPGYRSGYHDRTGPRHVLRVVSPPYFHPKSCQIGGTRWVVVTSGDRETLALGQQRQAAHPRPPDAHEVNRAGITHSKQGH